jgi:uncharacterized protein YciI
MNFFCYHQDRRHSEGLRQDLVEEHWAYMDGFAAQLIARGPTLSPDGETPTGSVHIVDVVGPPEARAFAFEEPNYQAGVYRDVLLRRWHNDLGRTMWEFPRGLTDASRFLVLGLAASQHLSDAPSVGVSPAREDIIAYGQLLSDDGNIWLGTAALLEASGTEEATALIAGGSYASVEVYRWDYGGRPG